jgi:hypothetical protein
MLETITTTEEAKTSCLAPAADVARRLGPVAAVKVLVPRRPGIVREARQVAQEVGVDVAIVEISAGSVYLQFAARADEDMTTPLAGAAKARLTAPVTRLGRWLQTCARRWYTARQ